MFQFSELFRTVHVEKGLRIRGSELDAVERGQKTAGTALVDGDDFIQFR